MTPTTEPNPAADKGTKPGTEAAPASFSSCCLHQLFSEQAARTPDAVALTLNDQHMSYRELDERTNQLAHLLRLGGVKPDAIVAIYLDRTFDLIIAILGVLKAGGAYLPIDLAYPGDRVAFMLQDAPVTVLLTHRSLAAQLPPHNAQVVCLDDSDALRTEPCGHLANIGHPGNLAYVIYTSGSTGRPKGALIMHQNVTRLFQMTDQWFHFNQGDVWTLFHSSAFDFSVWEIWGPLLYGGRLVIVPYSISRSPEAFYDLLRRQKVTVLNQTPSAFRQLMRIEETVGFAENLALRYVIFGGEALEMSSLKPWFDRHGDQQPRLINMYGITETTVHVTYRPLNRNDVCSGSVIGIPIPDLQLFILDSNLQSVPPGTPGELFVGGAGLARGYLNRPEMTSQRFVESALGAGGRIYRTGDLARLLPNGDVEYLGRIDQQVKIRGFRVELGEIEATLRLHPAIGDAVVIADEEGPGDRRLFAYLVVREGFNPTSLELRRHVLKDLPEYMAPAGFVFVKSIPLTENGKTDRSALREISRLAQSAPGKILAGDDVQRQILAIWLGALRRPDAGLDDNFFDLGGDSLLLAHVHTQLQAAFGRAFPITDLFAHPTVRALATHLCSVSPKSDAVAALRDRARRQREVFARGGAASA